MMKNRRLLLYVALVVIVALVPVGAIYHILWPHFLLQNEPLHSTIESVGALAAILMAILLLQRQPDEGGRQLFWVATGLLGAGILDSFHAISQPGQGFVLLHSTAVLVGGFGFALVWIPETYPSTSMRKWILWAVITGTILFGIWTFLFRGTLPVMVQDGQFTTIAKVLNLLSGILFIIAAGRFLVDFHRSSKLEPYLFSGMTLLFGLASLTFAYSALWNDAWWFWHLVRLSAYLLVVGFVIYEYRQIALSLRVKITEHKRAEERALYLNEILLTIRKTNQLIVEINDEAELLHKACATLVDGRNYKLAWIGFTAKDSYDVLPVAQAGFEDGYLSTVKITWDNSQYGQGPTGTTIKTGRPSVRRDTLNDERYSPWREQALKRGYASSAALPLTIRNEIIGALNVYSGKPDAFDDTEIAMLVELAGDISLGIERIRQQEQLRQSEERYRTLVDNALVGIFRTNLKGDILYVNDALASMFGFDNAEEMIAGGTVVRYKNPSDRAILIKELTEKGKVNSFELETLTKTGEVKIVVINVVLEGDTLSGMLQDITEHKHAEEALQKAHGELRNIYDTVADVIFVLGVESSGRYRFTSVNPAFYSVTGLNPDLVIGKYVNEIIPEPSLTFVLGKYEEAIREKRTVRWEETSEYPTGKLTGEVSVAPTFDLSGTCTHLVGSVHDITERKKAEEQLRIAEQNFRNSIDDSPLGIRIINAERDTIYANRAMLDIYGYDSLEELNATPFEKRYTPESYAELEVRDEKRRREESVPPNYEVSIVRKDGRIRQLEIFRKEVLWNGKRQFQMLHRDVTEHKQAEEKILQAAREWQTTFDSISDWVSIHDKDYKIIRVNKAFADFVKLKPEETIGRRCYELIHGEKEAGNYCSHQEALETGKSAYKEFYNPHLGIYMEVVCSPIFNEKGEIATTIHIGRDITERKRMETQMMVTDRLASIGELASGVAHELNNPLTGIIGFSELLLDKKVPADIREDLMVINREAKRTAQVVRNLLTFARKHPEEKQAVNINSTISIVLGLRAYEQKVNNIQVITRFAADLPELTADSFQLQQVFLNIIINAEYFMIEAHHGGTLTITTERIDNFVRVSIADDGPGIAQENLEHIFDPFFTTKEVGKGTGLGLSICHGTVTAHGGRIYAESELGKGATFIVELPISNDKTGVTE